MRYLNTILSAKELTLRRVVDEHVYIGEERRLEAASKIKGQGSHVFRRALHGFVLLRGNEAGFAVAWGSDDEYRKSVNVFGYAASLEGESGLCAQTGHWVESLVPFTLIKITTILSLEAKSDVSFRQGERCLWLRTANYEYAMMSPFEFCSSLWNLTLVGHNLTTACTPVPLETDAPSWWPTKSRKLWDDLQLAQRIAGLPAVRRQAVDALTSSRHSSDLDRGKRDASSMDAQADDTSANHDETPGSAKRARIADPDTLRALLDVSMKLSGEIVLGGKALRMSREMLYVTNLDNTNPWELGVPTKQPSPPEV